MHRVRQRVSGVLATKITNVPATDIISVLKQLEAGRPTSEILRKSGIPRATLRNWRMKYGGLDPLEIDRMRLKEENDKLKGLVDELSRECAILKHQLDGAPTPKRRPSRPAHIEQTAQSHNKTPRAKLAQRARDIRFRVVTLAAICVWQAGPPAPPERLQSPPSAVILRRRGLAATSGLASRLREGVRPAEATIAKCCLLALVVTGKSTVVGR